MGVRAGDFIGEGNGEAETLLFLTQLKELIIFLKLFIIISDFYNQFRERIDSILLLKGFNSIN